MFWFLVVVTAVVWVLSLVVAYAFGYEAVAPKVKRLRRDLEEIKTENENLKFTHVSCRDARYMKIRRVFIATCDSSWDQAIYVDGKLRTSDSSLYANCVADYVDEDDLVRVVSSTVKLDHDWFPDDELDLCLTARVMSKSTD